MKLSHQFVSVNASLEKSENSVQLFFSRFCLTVAWHGVPPALAKQCSMNHTWINHVSAETALRCTVMT